MALNSNSEIEVSWPEAVALFALGLLPSTSLPRIAGSALVAGLDSPALRELAGLLADQSHQSTALFERALAELKCEPLSQHQSALNYARYIAANILNGKIETLVGAARIGEAARAVHDEDFHDLDPFIYAESEAEDRPENRQFFANAVRKEAADLLNKAPN